MTSEILFSVLSCVRDQQTFLKGPIVNMVFDAFTGLKGFTGSASGKEPACQFRRHETWVRSLSWEDHLEEEMATHSSIFAWRSPCTEMTSGLQPRGSQRVGHS